MQKLTVCLPDKVHSADELLGRLRGGGYARHEAESVLVLQVSGSLWSVLTTLSSQRSTPASASFSPANCGMTDSYVTVGGSEAIADPHTLSLRLAMSELDVRSLLDKLVPVGHRGVIRCLLEECERESRLVAALYIPRNADRLAFNDGTGNSDTGGNLESACRRPLS